MKKLTITLTVILGLSMTTFAQGSMFHRENSRDNGNAVYESKGTMFRTDPLTPGLPIHGQTSNQDAPLGRGIALLTALGAAYLVGKKRREE